MFRFQKALGPYECVGACIGEVFAYAKIQKELRTYRERIIANFEPPFE